MVEPSSGEECKPPEIARLAYGQLRDQCLSPGPGERHRGAVDQLQGQQAPEPWHEGKQRRQNHTGPDKEQRDLACAKTVHQHADVDREKHPHDRAGADQDAHFGGVEPKRQRVKWHQKGIEIDIAHAERRGDIQRSQRSSAGTSSCRRPLRRWCGFCLLRVPAFFAAAGHGIAVEIQKSPIRAQPGAGIGDGVWTQRNGCGWVP